MNTENLFSFEYRNHTINNLDGSKSNFRQVYGDGGIVIACPKDSYHLVTTSDLSSLGNAFIEKGHKVNAFTHRNGELIGLNIGFGQKPSIVGDSNYSLFITVPNNGAGRGFLSIKQHRLVCSNGAVLTNEINKNKYIKIPHTIDYKSSLELVRVSIETFTELFNQVRSRDEKMNSMAITEVEIQFQLNKWFFEYELPKSQIGSLTFDQFRKMLAIEPENVPSIARYDELKAALRSELGYNEELNLKPSMFTVYAAVTNYLSRRIEKSGSTASNEVIFSRQSEKLRYFADLVTV